MGQSVSLKAGDEDVSASGMTHSAFSESSGLGNVPC